MFCNDDLAKLRLQRGADHLHKLGPRATAEFMAQLANESGCAAPMLALLADWEARMTPALVAFAGGDRFPPRPLREVPGQ